MPAWPDGGAYRPFRLVEEAEPTAAQPAGVRLFSPEAAREIAGILTDLRRPDLPEAWDLTRDGPAVAWKTGTSYGHRDAWAVGFSRRYTIGVWVGNFDGRPRKGISGSQHAGPLLFDLFRALGSRGAGGSGTPDGRSRRRSRSAPRAASCRGRTARSAGGCPICPASPISSNAPGTGGCWWTPARASCWPATAWPAGPTPSAC